MLDSPSYSWEKWQQCYALRSNVRRPILRIFGYVEKTAAAECTIAQSQVPNKPVMERWRKLAEDAAAGYSNIHFIDLQEAFCHDGTCSMLNRSGDLMYQDIEHLNIKGSLNAAPLIMERLRQ